MSARQFARLSPLNQSDLPLERQHVDFSPRLPAGVRIENPSRDYTPPRAHLHTSLIPRCGSHRECKCICMLCPTTGCMLGWGLLKGSAAGCTRRY